jgi:hypothetical protein
MTKEQRDAIRERISFDDVSLHDAIALLTEVERLRDVLLDTAVWCHAGHGDHPKSTCGLCRPIIEALRDKE